MQAQLWSSSCTRD